jgi:hypothetical protein
MATIFSEMRTETLTKTNLERHCFTSLLGGSGIIEDAAISVIFNVMM